MTNRIDCKIVLLGQAYGGKTSLVERFLNNTFNDELPYSNTVGAAFSSKNFICNNKEVKLGIWDTAGSERYEAMARMYYRDAKAAIVCYDVTVRENFDRVQFWVNELKETEENCKLYLTGTKLDLVRDYQKKREVDFHDASDYSDNIGAFLIETSSKTGENVIELFEKIVDDFVKDPTNAANLKDATDNNYVDLKQTHGKHKHCCKS